MRWELKIRIVTVLGNQIKGACAMGMRESRLSLIVNGHVDPNPQEKEVFKRMLGYDFDTPESPKAA